MKKGIRRFALLAAAALAAGAISGPARAEEAVTDAEIRALFGQSHMVMKDQRDRIRQIFDGFLLGDETLIQRNAAAIGDAMKDVGRDFPPEEGQQVEVWKAMAGVVEAARALKEKSEQGDYAGAYQQFTIMTAHCIECHQVRRDWGVFSPPPAPELEKEPEKEKP